MMKHCLLYLFLFISPLFLFAQIPENDTLLIDFGSTISPAPWNNLADPVAGEIDNLTNSAGFLTDYGITVFDAFNNINTAGTQMPDAALGFPPTATSDSFFGNVAEFGGQEQPTAGVALTDLRDKPYTLTIFASREATDNREAQYIIEGQSVDTIYLDAASNADRIATTTMRPDTSGRIQITVSPGPNNTNSSGFYYLGLLTVVYEHEEIPDTEVGDAILIDFGSNPSPAPWNNVTDPAAGAIEDLLSDTGVPSGISLMVIDSFNNINTAGTQMPDTTLGFPSTATSDSFFGNVATFGGQEQPTGGILLGGLELEKAYMFTIFASREATDNREAQYVLEGASIDTVYLDAASNTDSVAVAILMPAEDGTIRLTASPGPNNTNSSGFYYLGAIRVEFDPTPVEAPLDTILVDFGNNFTPAPWNNIADPAAGEIEDLSNSGGFQTGYGIRIFDAFNNINTAGTVNPDPALGIPATASGDSFFGNTVEFGGQTQPTGGIELTNLKTDKEYTVVIFASRVASDNRETAYLVEGNSSETLYLNASSNSDSVVMATLLPDANGIIRVTASPGPNNNNASGFFYLGAMKVIYENEEPAGGVTLDLVQPNGGEFWQVGKTASIEWQSRNVLEVALEYSTDNGNSWTPIDTVSAIQQSYNWIVPNAPCSECLVRISADTLLDVSEDNFEISTDTSSFTIVVLGSSTAAGTGASAPDSSWVNRYRNFLENDTRYEVINLALGGYTTYHILPTGTDIPPNVSINIDQNRNLTRALTFDPCAIIVNMPSNDAANNFPVADQLDNFATIVQAAESQGVATWIATTQPRNFTNPSQVQIQQDVRDSIFAIYGDFAIDFWNDLADAMGFIQPEYDSGDGVHVNDAGHRLLFEQVVAKMIDTTTCDMSTGIFQPIINKEQFVRAYPNPVQDVLTVEYTVPSAGTLEIRLLDVLGRTVFQQVQQVNNVGTQTLNLDMQQVQNFSSSVLYGLFTFENNGQLIRNVVPVVVAGRQD